MGDQRSVMELIKLLENKVRLPCPKDCPHEVILHAHIKYLFDLMSSLIMITSFYFYLQVKILMEQCWAADPAQRPSFSFLIEKFEAIRQTFDWQSNINFSLAKIC